MSHLYESPKRNIGHARVTQESNYNLLELAGRRLQVDCRFQNLCRDQDVSLAGFAIDPW